MTENHLWDGSIYPPAYSFSDNFHFDSWDEMIRESKGLDKELNFLCQWSWVKPDPNDYLLDPNEHDLTPEEIEAMEKEWAEVSEMGDSVILLFIQPRRGVYMSYKVWVTEEDEPKVREYLNDRWELMKRVWEPISQPIS